jgi:putative oxidoreductase
LSDAFALVGRLLLAVMFVYAGYGKIGGFGTAGYIASKGLPLAQLAAAAIAVKWWPV